VVPKQFHQMQIMIKDNIVVASMRQAVARDKYSSNRIMGCQVHRKYRGIINTIRNLYKLMSSCNMMLRRFNSNSRELVGIKG
jgi:hypothetical protein